MPAIRLTRARLICALSVLGSALLLGACGSSPSAKTITTTTPVITTPTVTTPTPPKAAKPSKSRHTGAHAAHQGTPKPQTHGTPKPRVPKVTPQGAPPPSSEREKYQGAEGSV
jgi:hypothetical protein